MPNNQSDLKEFCWHIQERLFKFFLVDSSIIQAKDHKHLAGISNGCPADNRKTKILFSHCVWLLVWFSTQSYDEANHSVHSVHKNIKCFHRTAACTVTGVDLFSMQEVIQDVKVFYSCVPVHDISPSLACNHVQQRVTQVHLNAFESHHQVPEYDDAKVVNIFQVVLLNIHPVLVHKTEWWSRNMSWHLSKCNLVPDKEKRTVIFCVVHRVGNCWSWN